MRNIEKSRVFLSEFRFVRMRLVEELRVAETWADMLAVADALYKVRQCGDAILEEAEHHQKDAGAGCATTPA